jgi:hypothetical protein
VNDPSVIVTQLADLSGLTIDDVQRLSRGRLADHVENTLRQVERPRVNLGGSAPPGRAD